MHDPAAETERSIYCLRHTTICMRIILSQGKFNIFNLAENAGTSVEQIERSGRLSVRPGRLRGFA